MANELLTAWTDLVKATVGPETADLLRSGDLSHEEVVKRLEAKGMPSKEIQERLKGLAEGFVHQHLLPENTVPRPMHVPPMASPRVYRAPYNAFLPYQFSTSQGGFDCDGRRLPPVGPNNADEVMDQATGRVAHNVVCSHTGWGTAATLAFRRCSMVGVQVTIAHAKPMTYWVNATRTSTMHRANGTLAFWGSSSAVEDTFLALEVYGPGDQPGFPTMSVWGGPQSHFAASNPGSLNSVTVGTTSAMVSVQSGPTFPVGTKVFILAGIGTRHTAATSFADITTWTMNDWTIDSISMWP